MQVIVDRFEGEDVVVEIKEGFFGRISKSLIPDSKEGDVIDIIINRGETKKEKKELII